MNTVYFDHSATTPTLKEAAEAFLQAATVDFGNPSSRHAKGQAASAKLKSCKKVVMQALGASDGELIFTAGGTEANNLAIFGRLYAKERYSAGMEIVTTASEHASVTESVLKLSQKGHRVHFIPCTGGVLDMKALESALSPKTVLVSLMLVCNETGALYDIAQAVKLVRAKCPDALIHTDATQAFLKVPFSVSALGVDAVTVSGHKVGAPKGIGALWIAPSVIKQKGIVPTVYGGGQEGGLRSGTENMPSICAFARAVEIEKETLSNRIESILALRTYICTRLKEDEAYKDVAAHTAPAFAPHILSLTVKGFPAETTLNFLSASGICVSAGSACSSNAKKAKAAGALVDFGLSEKDAASTVRLSFGASNTKEEADLFLEVLKKQISTLFRRR